MTDRNAGSPTILVVMGTRPEAIKLAPVVWRLKGDSRVDLEVATTGQHDGLLSQTLESLDISVDHPITLVRTSGDLNALVPAVVERIDRLIAALRPDSVVVQGDTTSAFLTALCAFHLEVPVAHVEAGLRTYDSSQPFPEEANRQMIRALSSLHLAPTILSAENLQREGVDRSRLVVTGNTAVDTLLGVLNRIKPEPQLTDTGRPTALITIHRRERWNRSSMSIRTLGKSGIESVFEGIHAAAEQFSEIDFFFPIHPNPAVREPARRLLSGVPNIQLSDPLPYVEFVTRLAAARLIITDSGGIQEEAPSLGIPVLVLRESTERPEAHDCGIARLIGTDSGQLRRAIGQALQRPVPEPGGRPYPSPFGDGRAASRIHQALLHLHGLDQRPLDFEPDNSPAAELDS